MRKNKDLVGQKFGMLTVTEDSGKRRANSVLWRCKCDCGGEILALRHQLVSGSVQNCGCIPKTKQPQATDLIGRRFGLLTVLGDSGQRNGSNSIYWRCKCDCGGEILATRTQLESGNAMSCGCVSKEHASTGKAEDLTGRKFGELTVLYRAENDKYNRVCWMCRCSCGKETTVQALKLKSGHTQSCGCKRHRSPSPFKKDLTGRRFGRLTVLCASKGTGEQVLNAWHCRCDCGKELDVYSGNLLRGMTQSCGCWNREQQAKMHEHMHFRDNTCVERLERVATDMRENKAGFRGLFLTKSGKYRATITFQGRHYHLGYYNSFDKAVQVRLEAEETLHEGYIKAFDLYEKRAEEDSKWAEDNPFFYTVQCADGKFQVQTNGLYTNP